MWVALSLVAMLALFCPCQCRGGVPTRGVASDDQSQPGGVDILSPSHQKSRPTRQAYYQNNPFFKGMGDVSSFKICAGNPFLSSGQGQSGQASQRINPDNPFFNGDFGRMTPAVYTNNPFFGGELNGIPNPSPTVYRINPDNPFIGDGHRHQEGNHCQGGCVQFHQPDVAQEKPTTPQSTGSNKPVIPAEPVHGNKPNIPEDTDVPVYGDKPNIPEDTVELGYGNKPYIPEDTEEPVSGKEPNIPEDTEEHEGDHKPNIPKDTDKPTSENKPDIPEDSDEPVHGLKPSGIANMPENESDDEETGSLVLPSIWERFGSVSEDGHPA